MAECRTCVFWTPKKEMYPSYRPHYPPTGECCMFRGYYQEELENRKNNTSDEFRFYTKDEIIDNPEQYEIDDETGLYTKIKESNEIEYRNLNVLTEAEYYCKYYKVEFSWEETNFSITKTTILLFLNVTLFFFILYLINMFYSGFDFETNDIGVAVVCSILFSFLFMCYALLFTYISGVVLIITKPFTKPYFLYLQSILFLKIPPQKIFDWLDHFKLSIAISLFYIVSSIIMISSIYGIIHFWNYWTSP